MIRSMALSHVVATRPISDQRLRRIVTSDTSRAAHLFIRPDSITCSPSLHSLIPGIHCAGRKQQFHYNVLCQRECTVDFWVQLDGPPKG